MNIHENEVFKLLEGGVLGVIVGDALGVPVEFKSRKQISENPVSQMIGNGTHFQLPGTWSDDSSLTLCLVDEMCGNFTIEGLGNQFVDWLYKNKWTARKIVFDVGETTRESIERIRRGETAFMSGSFSPGSNGNGSLMRILPLVLETRKISDPFVRYKLVKDVSSITHAHVRSSLACYYYLEFAHFLILNRDKPILESYQLANDSLINLMQILDIDSEERKVFDRIVKGDIHELEEQEIFSSGYVIHTLEASLWCMLRSDSFSNAVLKAVNLGNDSDTTGAVTGGLAGIYYGRYSIPSNWLSELARIEDIYELLGKLRKKYDSI